ncbi:amidohydrolase family protein [Roseivirga seohaensis]|nr:amidohydrolase family protein [Roseivirga seohaensis]
MKLLLMKTIRAVFLMLLTVSTIGLKAQSDPTGESAVTRTFAITNATVIQAPGKELKGATVVIKNGLIDAVGTNVTVPKNAQLIDGKDMYVYAAFIDGLSNTGAKRPENMPRPNNLFSPDPPNDYAGITPERSLVDQLDIESNTIGSLRKEGFAISHSVPYGRMLPGSGSIILLGDKKHADDLVLSKDVSMFTQFAGAPGAYPGNVLGIMAKFRNLYRNAENDKKHFDSYAQNPSGLERPERDRVTEAFFPVVTKQRPVMFDVSGVLEVQRAIRLQKDLGFKLMVGNVKQAWDLGQMFKENGTNVFLSLDLPDAPKEAKGKDKDEMTEEAKRLEARKMDFYKKYTGQAASLANTGVKFGFSSLDVASNKIKANLLTMIENGLSENDALAALTTNPAGILGIDKIAGTVEAGKIANIMISNAPYFTKDSQIKFMFVDGDKYDFEIKEKSAAGNGNRSAAAGNDPVVGTWTYNFETPQGATTGKMIIGKEGTEYNGKLTSNDGGPDNDMQEVSFVNGTLSFSFSIDAGGQSVELVVTGTVTGKQYDAEVSVSAFNFSTPLTATKDDGQ